MLDTTESLATLERAIESVVFEAITRGRDVGTIRRLVHQIPKVGDGGRQYSVWAGEVIDGKLYRVTICDQFQVEMRRIDVLWPSKSPYGWL